MDSSDQQIRLAAGNAIQKLIQQKGENIVSWAEIAAGFGFKGQKIHLASRANGIFKPKELSDKAALSIRHARPSRAGRNALYDDYEMAQGIVNYKLERRETKGDRNMLLQEALVKRLPLIFFQGVSDAFYRIHYPTYVIHIDWEREDARISLGDASEEEDGDGTRVQDTIEKGYSYGVRKSRRHQIAFRNCVLNAYGLRCALTGLPIPKLLEASHIIADAKDGEASVKNGIAMTKFHHAAYEGNLMGIDADGKIHLSDVVKDTRDGPMFDYGLLQLEGASIRLPKFEGHKPSRDFLAQRFEEFKLHR